MGVKSQADLSGSVLVAGGTQVVSEAPFRRVEDDAERVVKRVATLVEDVRGLADWLFGTDSALACSEGPQGPVDGMVGQVEGLLAAALERLEELKDQHARLRRGFGYSAPQNGPNPYANQLGG